MPQQFVVPQFIDAEAKIIGPITGRQFLILLVGVLFGFLAYRIFLRSIILVIIAEVLIVTASIIFAFAKVNGQPFHYIALNMIQTFRKPRTRVWDKKVSDAEIRANLKKPEAKIEPILITKKPLQGSRLSELSLVVNTGGSYEPDQDVTDMVHDSETQVEVKQVP